MSRTAAGTLPPNPPPSVARVGRGACSDQRWHASHALDGRLSDAERAPAGGLLKLLDDEGVVPGGSDGARSSLRVHEPPRLLGDSRVLVWSG